MARERCTVTSKQSFPDKVTALLAQQRWSTPMSAYECEHCGGWHLTSKGYKGQLVTTYAGGDERLA